MAHLLLQPSAFEVSSKNYPSPVWRPPQAPCISANRLPTGKCHRKSFRKSFEVRRTQLLPAQAIKHVMLMLCRSPKCEYRCQSLELYLPRRLGFMWDLSEFLKLFIQASIPRIVLAKKVALHMRFERDLEAVHRVPQLVSLELTWARVKHWIELLSRVKIKACTINWQTCFTVNREVFEVTFAWSMWQYEQVPYQVFKPVHTCSMRLKLHLTRPITERKWKYCATMVIRFTKYVFQATSFVQAQLPLCIPFYTCPSPIWRMQLMKYLNST